MPSRSVRFDFIQTRPDWIKPVSLEEVVNAENVWGTPYPSGYREFVTTLGGGVINGYLSVFSPYWSAMGTTHFIQCFGEEWFWDSSLLKKSDAKRCIALGKTMDGDHLVFRHKRPGAIYVVPRHDNKIHLAGNTLLQAIHWLLTSGVIVQKQTTFEFKWA